MSTIAFATVALLLAALGVYGVMSHATSERTHEIGVRMALGAQRRDVVRLVVGHGARLIAVGIAVGLGGAYAATRLLEALAGGAVPDRPLLVTSDPLLLESLERLCAAAGVQAAQPA